MTQSCFILFNQELVLEKESRIRETMFMMGLKQSILWSTWYLKEFIFLMISVIIVCILLKVIRNYCDRVYKTLISYVP